MTNGQYYLSVPKVEQNLDLSKSSRKQEFCYFVTIIFVYIFKPHLEMYIIIFKYLR